MKKKYLVVPGMCIILVLGMTYPLHAEDFSGREDEMNQKCAAIYDKQTQSECAAYKEYLNNKASTLKGNVNDLQDQIAVVKGDISKVSEKINENNQQIKKANENLTNIQKAIDLTNTNIGKLNVQIKEKKVSIKTRDEQMKSRLTEMQPYVGSNNYVDFLMGATSFTDLLRRTSIIGELNDYEQTQIEALNKEREELQAKQEEVKAKKDLLQVQHKEIENQKAKAEQYKQANEELLVLYQKEESRLAEEKRTAQVKSGQFASSIPNIDLSILPKDWGSGNSGNNGGNGNQKPGGDVPDLSSGFIRPVRGTTYISAGTWAYPGGSEHLGMDYGTYNRVGLPLVAPAAGVVVAINDGVANHGVYESGLGKWDGYPAGGGNTLHMITNVNGVAYGISFYHLSPGMFNVSVGSVVKQGQTIAHTGHSGNSSGPHCHVEFTRLGNVSINKAIQIFYDYGKDYFYGNYSADGRCDIKGTTPCLERPENYIS